MKIVYNNSTATMDARISLFLLVCMAALRSSSVALAFRSVGPSQSIQASTFSCGKTEGNAFLERCNSYLPLSSSLSLSLSSSSSLNGQNEPTNPTDTIEENIAVDQPPPPMSMASGFSGKMDMVEAIQEAVTIALDALPPSDTLHYRIKIDLAVVSVSSLYDGSYRPSLIVPTILEAASSYGDGIQHLVGSTCGGFISSISSTDSISMEKSVHVDNGVELNDNDDDDDDDDDDNGKSDSSKKKKKNVVRACQPVERQGVPGVSIVLCVLPGVQLRTFHVTDDDVPDDGGSMSSEHWKTSVGLSTKQPDDLTKESSNDESSVVLVIPSPGMSDELDNFLRGIKTHIPGCNIFGAIASTVSSLSRARLFRHDATINTNGDGVVQTLTDGCVGVVMEGDITVQTMIAQGAKAVGGVYQIVKGQNSTISVVALDETATELVRQDEENDDGDDDNGVDYDEVGIGDEKAKKSFELSAAYAKARIPKPILAEANFVMKTLSDDDQAFMRKTLLVGIENSSSPPSRMTGEISRLTEGKDHRYSVHQVAGASAKDGSVTFGSVNIEQGSRIRFFVRDSDYAKKEVEALWNGYKARRSTESTATHQGGGFTPTGCFLFPTLDRGSNFFSGKTGYESSAILKYAPNVPCISGFFGNGVIGSMSSSASLSGTNHELATTKHGSGSGYFVIGSKSGRPVYSPAKSVNDNDGTAKEKQKENGELNFDGAKETQQKRVKSFDQEKKALRDERGELVIKRREVNSGRALTVSTVEWSVAENMAKPTSVLEGYMWDKETEVDRFRERVPLVNLVSQCKLSEVDSSKPKPRDWIGPIKERAAKTNFVIVPECKRTEPVSGSLRKRYNIPKLVKEFTTMGAPALSINCDAVMFGGCLDDLTKAREASSKAALELSAANDEKPVLAPPILASDLVLYPYQLYKIRLAAGDAVNLVVGALAKEDLMYLTKITSNLLMQSLLTVTSAAQIENLNMLPTDSFSGLIVSNREVRA